MSQTAYTRGSNRSSLTSLLMDGKIILGCCGFITILLIAIIVSALQTIAAGHVGVVKRFGEVVSFGENGIMEPGLNTKTPFITKVEEIDCRISTISYSNSAFSKDLQKVHTEASLQYSLIKESVPQMVKFVGNREALQENIIQNAIAESLKAVVANYKASQLISERKTVKDKIREKLEFYINKSFEIEDVNGNRNSVKIGKLVDIANLAITDFSFSEGFNLSIEAKVKAEQEAERAAQEKKRKITQAEADAEARKLKADGIAYEIKQKAESRAEAIIREAKALKNNENLIKLRMIETWDGVLPKFTGGSGGHSTLLDVGKMMQ